MNAKDIAYGYAIGYNDGIQNSGSGGGEDWQPPEHWLDIPEPADNQVIMYVEAQVGDVAPFVWSYEDIAGTLNDSNYGNFTINYGDDGYTYEVRDNYADIPYHVYQTAGQYIITITVNYKIVMPNATGSSVAFMVGHTIENYSSSYPSGYCKCIRAIKVGKNVQLNNSTIILSSTIYQNLIYIKFCGKINTFPFSFGLKALKRIEVADCSNITTLNDCGFSGCMSLEKIDIFQNVTTMGSSSPFQSCYSLKEISLPSITDLSSRYYFSSLYNLKKFYAPLCTAIYSAEFEGCYSLQEITLAENCNLNGNTFSTCPQIYKP